MSKPIRPVHTEERYGTGIVLCRGISSADRWLTHQFILCQGRDHRALPGSRHYRLVEHFRWLREMLQIHWQLSRS